MKKMIVVLMLAVFSLGTLTQLGAQTQTPAATHVKKDGTADKRFKENKTAKGPVTKSGKADMRYKANNPNAGKKKKS